MGHTGEPHYSSPLENPAVLKFETWTNLAYGIVGLLVFAWFRTGESAVFAASMIYLNIGSALFHRDARWIKRYADLDVSAMYAVFGGLAWYSGLALFGQHSWVGMALFSATCAYLLRYQFPGWLHIRMGIAGVWIMGFILLKDATNWPLVLTAFLLFAGSFIARDRDENGTFKWGHGLWHLGTAPAIGLLFIAIATGPQTSFYRRDPRIRQVEPSRLMEITWYRTERCVGRHSDFKRVRWFLIPDAMERQFVNPETGEPIVGLAIYPVGNDTIPPEIYMLERLQHRTDVIAHEAVHVISRKKGHPPNLFGPRGCAPEWFIE